MSDTAGLTQAGVVTAGTTAITVSVSNSMTAGSLYTASLEQIVAGDFNVVMSDVLGVVSLAALLFNIYLSYKK